MKKLIFSILLLSFLSLNAQVQKNFIDQNYIELTGTSRLEVSPNEIYLTIKISENNKKLKLSVEKQEKLMIDELKKNNIKLDENFTIKDFRSYYSYGFLKTPDIKKSKIYELMLTNANELAIVYKSLEKIGISNITINRVDHSDIEDFKLQVKINAIKIAKTKAKKYAEAIDQSIGRALYIQEVDDFNFGNSNFRSNNSIIQGYNSYHSEVDKFEKKNIEFKNIEIKARVLAKFEIK